MKEHADNDGPRILVVEDDQALRDDLALALGLEGYRVHACALGLEAIELASQQEFDLVISDIRMAGMDGLETVERLQQKQPSVATLIITGYTDEADSIRAVRLGVGDYLKKPFRLDEFLAAVARQLSQHRARKQRAQRELNLGRTAVWTLESWLTQLERSESVLAGRRARELADELGMNSETSAQPQLAVLLEALRSSLPVLNLQSLPAEFLSLLEEMGGEDVGMSARVAKMALAPEPPDSNLAQAWHRAQLPSSPQSEAEHALQRKRRGQLLLARSQEQSGQVAEALENYRALLDQQDREQVEAQLGLMRLQQAEPALCRQHAQAALSLSSRLQPLLHAVTSLEAGLYLAQSGARDEGAASFERAVQLAEQLGQPLLQARARLALAASNPSVLSDLGPALQRLLDPADRYELMDSAWWMVPLLLRRQAQSPHPLQERLLRTLGRDVPGVFLRLAQAGRLDGPTRCSLVQALTDNSHPTAQNCLRLLAGDAEASVRKAAEQVLQAGIGKPVPPTLRIYTLGSFEVWRGEERVADSAFRSWKQRFLLARLAGTSRPVAAERLIDEFWPDDADGGRASLNVGVSHMRKLLRPSPWPEELDYVPRNASGLSLNRELPIWHDFEEFEKASEGDSLAAWQQAVELYRGPYLDNCYQEWAVAQRSRAENLMITTLLKLLEKLHGSQRPQEVLLYGNRLLELDSCSQEAHLAVMQAQLELGRPEAALRQFDVCKRVLEREMGLEPSIAMLEMRQRVLLCT